MKNKSSEQGQAIVLLVLLITGLVAIAGLAIDGGRLYSARRNAQNAADNAALAAALAMCSNQNASTAALASAATNSFNNNGTTNTVDVNIPPSSGPNAGDSSYIEVVIDSSETGTISRLVYKGQLAYSARAVGHCTNSSLPPGNGYALIVLHDDGGPDYDDPYDRYPLKSKPGGLIFVDGNIWVESDSPAGYSSYGHDCGQAHASYGVKADAGATVGPSIYEDCPPNYINPNPSLNASPMGDPLASLASPQNPGGACNPNLTFDNNDVANLTAGCYNSITVEDNAQVTLGPGLYYFVANTGITLRNNGRMTGTNVMIFINQGDIVMQDSAIMTISALDSGTYKGMVLFMDNGNILYVHENAQLTITSGTVYAPNTFLQVYGLTSGNRAYLRANASQIIVDSVWVGSSSNCTTYSSCPGVRGDLLLTYNASLIYGSAGDTMIELSE
jgi:hypothetical protein